MIRLSIIVPVYGVEQYIKECIRSLYAQDIPQEEYEVICVDDCSPDGSRAIDYLTKLAVSNPDVDFFYMDCATTSDGERFYTLRNNEPVIMPLIDYYDYEYAQYGSTPQGCVCGILQTRVHRTQSSPYAA